MRLYDEIFKNTDAGARFTVAEHGGAYFEGVKTVGECSPERIVLYLSRSAVEIEGAGLFIETYTDGDMRLGGTVTCVRLQNKG